MSKKRSKVIIPLFIPHFGCPFQCVFCNQNKITNREEAILPEDVESIVQEYRKTIDRTQEVELAFYGGSFTALKKNLMESYLKEGQAAVKKYGLAGIRLSTRPDAIDESILRTLKAYGVKTIELGVQSTDDEVLRLSGRGHFNSHMVRASEQIKAFGFRLGHQMMLGLPGADREKDYQTALDIVKAKAEIVRIYPTLVIRDTPLAKLYQEGKYQPYSLEETVVLVKELLILFAAHDVEVIRIGLQTTENINDKKDVIAGPFHPALGFLAKEALYEEIIRPYLKEIKQGSVTIKAPSDRIHYLIGLNQKKKKCYEQGFPQLKLRFLTDNSLKKEEIIIESSEKTYAINSKEACRELYLKRSK